MGVDRTFVLEDLANGDQIDRVERRTGGMLVLLSPDPEWEGREAQIFRPRGGVEFVDDGRHCMEEGSVNLLRFSGEPE